MADRILVVDDEEKIREVIKKYGEFEGYEIYEAENGMEAVEMCRDNDYDLIIMDVMMPELDGFSACGAIHKTKDIPVIMLSARGEEYDLLFFMVRNRNIALEREKLITEVWGYDYYGEDRTLDTHIKLLRNSLGKYRDMLVTLRGVGYRFEVDD